MGAPADRLERLAQAVAERGLGVLIVSAAANVRWLTGFTGSNGVALVTPGGAGAFLTDFRYDAQSAAQLSGDWKREIVSGELLGPAIAGRFPDVGGAPVGYDDRHASVHAGAALAAAIPDGSSLEPAGGLVEDLRVIKDAGEIAAIRAAAQLADAALAELLTRGLVGRTEAEVALDLEFTMRRAGAQAISFEPIVAAGAHGALPHATPRTVAIPAGVLVTIDWGAQLDGYCSDCTRTLATGDISGEPRAIYEIVLEAQLAGLGAVRPGQTGREVDAVARAVIDGAGYGERYGHGLGHGVGLEVHEGPRLSKLGDQELAAGMVVTVEPGIYLPGSAGVRIEDLVLVTAAGHEVLNTLPKELVVVD